MKPDKIQAVSLMMFSGCRFHPYLPTDDEIRIEDIAHGLAGKFRWAGQSPRRYSVAQHSVEVSLRVPRELALQGLLHDAPEAYLADIPAPLKTFLRVDLGGPGQGMNYRCLEDLIYTVIARKFGVNTRIEEAVHDADRRERARERRDLFGKTSQEDAGYEPDPQPIEPAWPTDAEIMFLERFDELYYH